MSTAVMSSPMFECAELFKNSASSAPKAKEAQTQAQGNGHAPLRRSYTSLVSLIEQHRKLDRSVSEPTSRYKTELCRPFEESGSCKYGDKCQFAHGCSELRNLARHPKYKTELCRTFHKVGFCPYGPRCHFVHNFEEARIHNLKVSAQLGQPQPSLASLGPLLQPATAAALNASLLEQLAASPLVRANSLSLAFPQAQQQQHHHQALQRSSSLQQQPILIETGLGRPKPLNLSPTFSLGSAADSISPSSSLSQSPTNSMASFFSDEAGSGGLQQQHHYQQQQHHNQHQQQQQPTTAFSFGQDFGLLSARQSPSPQSVFDEQSPRTPSPQAPNPECRLPVFNRISKTIAQLDNLKI